MQTQVKHNVPALETRTYLRVATITNKQSPLFFLYIGCSETAVKLLLASGNSGLIAENITEAKRLIALEDFSEKAPNVVILDIPYQEQEFIQFQNFFAQHMPNGAHTPFILNAEQLQGDKNNCKGIDDIVNLSNWQFDFAAKVDFLHKAKSFKQPKLQRNLRIQPKRCMYKRAFDIVISSLLILIALPIFLLIAMAIRLESKGPILYNARRAGRGFRVFKFYKFRTMVVNADKKIEAVAHLNQYNGGQFLKIKNDPRVTKVGRILRNTSLDELPQLFNVLKGDMSLVGNRPLPLYEAATLTTNDFVERFMAPAGITGLWQIKKRGKADMSVEERIMLDISYARKSNLLNDLWIMAQTPAALIQKADV
jgi:lipopolysaccharide/colanic/teichoic acid biosynthesis glycosyltransferase